MKAYRLAHLGALIAILGIAASQRPAEAIPAWARSNGLSCATCHAPFPNLKPTGGEFLRNGLRLVAGEAPPNTIDVDDSLLTLPATIPISIRIDGYGSIGSGGKTRRSDIEFPWVFKIISGGPITRRASYFVYFLAEEGEIVGLEDAWVQINRVFDLPFDIQAGEFQVCDPMFERELRLERLDYEVFETEVGTSAVTLTYDRGITATWHAPRKTEVIFEIVNGNGIPAVGEEGGFDKDSYKNPALRVAREFGPVRIGLFGYYGKERGGDSSAVARHLVNRTTFFGPDLVARLGERWRVSGEYLERRDSDPFFIGAGSEDLVTRGGFGEVQFYPFGEDGRWILTALYNRVDSDDPSAGAESASLTSNHLLARNLRLLFEAQRDVRANENRMIVGLIGAF